MQSTQDEAKAAISQCQRWKEQSNLLREAKLRAADLAIAKFSAQGIAGIILLALAIGFRAKIAAGLYNFFVGCLALWLRFNRSRKRFLDNAIKKAENRLG